MQFTELGVATVDVPLLVAYPYVHLRHSNIRYLYEYVRQRDDSKSTCSYETIANKTGNTSTCTCTHTALTMVRSTCVHHELNETANATVMYLVDVHW